MNMTELLRICGFALLCASTGVLLARWQSEYASLVRIGGILLLGAFLIGGMSRGVETVLSLFGADAVTPYARVMLRALGIGLLVRLCAEICGECGAGSLSMAVELTGKLFILILCIPLIQDILALADRILQMGKA